MSISLTCRKLAFLLVFVIASGAFVQGPGATVAYAAPGDFNILSQGIIMTAGSAQTGTTPEIISNSNIFVEAERYSGQKKLELMDRLGDLDTQLVTFIDGVVGLSSVAKYELEYPIGPKLMVKVTLERKQSLQGGGATFEVNYELYDYTNFSITGFAEKVDANNTFQVFVGSDGFRNPENYSLSESVQGIITWQVHEEGGKKIPRFTISSSQLGLAGFSFRYAGRTVHFMLRDGRFYFATDGIQPGQIYDFVLTRTFNPGMGVPQRVKSPYYAYPVPEFTPYSHVGQTGAPASGYSIEDVLRTSTVPYLVNEFSGLSTNERPGAREQQLHVKFPRLLQWNEDEHNFTGNITTDIEISLELHDRPDGNSNTKSFRVKDAGKAPAVMNVNDIEAHNTVIAGVEHSIENAREYFTVVLGDMEPGQIFRGEVKGNTTGTNLVTRPTYLGYGSAYTLMEYTFVGESMIIWPYKGVTGTYVIGANSLGNFPYDNLHEHYFPREYVVTTVEDRTGSGASVARPIPISPDRSTYYRVVFIMEENSNVKILSQASWAMLVPHTSLKTPTEFFINAGLSRAPDWFTGEKGELTLDLRWDLGSMALINALVSNSGDDRISLAYDISKSLVPRDEPGNYEKFAEMKLNVVLDGDLILNENPLAVSNIDVYSPIGGLFIGTERVKITNGLNTLTNIEHYYIEASLRFSANSANYNRSAAFIYPNIYFVQIKPTKLGDTPLDNIGAAPAKSFTLNHLTPPEAAPPQRPQSPKDKLVTSASESGEITEVSLAYEFTMPDYMKFIEYYAPELDEENMDLKLHFYIAQSEAALNRTAYRDNDGENKPFYSLSPERKAEVAAVTQHTGESRLYFAVSKSALTVTGGANGRYNGMHAREVLRGGDAVWIKDLKPLIEASGVPRWQQNFIFDGLDANQSYYIYSEIELVFTSGNAMEAVYNRPEDNQSQVQRKELRVLTGVSELVGITTKGLVNTPTPEEKTPAAPTDLGIRDVGDTSATLEWKGTVASGEMIEYEILRIRNEQIKDDGGESLITNRSSFSELWDKLPNHLTVKQDAQKNASSNHAMRTSGREMLRWNPAISKFENVDEMFYTYDPNGADGFIVYEDRTLTPNQVYFYYVRTVKITNGVETYSNWVHTTLTTAPVKRPAGLKVEPPRPGQEYDMEREVIFSFESEVHPDSIKNGEFSFWYELKKEGTSWGAAVRMDAAMLDRWMEPVGLTGRYRYMYHVTGLENGTSYTVRVYTQDVGGNRSLYSNEVMFKTELDQNEYDKKEELDRWREYFRNLLDQLLKNPYWSLYDTTGRIELVYRPTMFDQLIVEAMDTNINLAEGGIARAIYHIPASAFVSAQNAGKGFRIMHDNVEVIIPASAIDFSVNARMIDMNEKVRAGSVADYYITLTFDRRYIPSVAGLEAATQETSIRFDVIENTITADRWDKDMFSLLAAEMERKAIDDRVLDGLKKRIEDKRTSEDIIRYIESVVDEIIREFSSTIRSEFSSVTRSEYRISLDKKYTVIGKNTAELMIGNGYEYVAGAWVQHETTPYGEGRAIYPTAAGTFIFAGRPSSIAALEGVLDGARMTALIYKYNLEDFFGQISYETLELYVTRDMLAGTAARIAGAPRGVDSITWLNQNRQMGLSTRGSQAPIEMQEALYLVVSLYEFQTNTPIANIQIRNFAITNNMTGLENKYRQHVRAAFELGIYSDRNMKPGAVVKVREILKILVDLDKRVK